MECVDQLVYTELDYVSTVDCGGRGSFIRAGEGEMNSTYLNAEQASKLIQEPGVILTHEPKPEPQDEFELVRFVGVSGLVFAYAPKSALEKVTGKTRGN